MREAMELFYDKEFYNNESKMAGTRFRTSLSWEVKAKQLNQFYSLPADEITF